MPEMMSMTLTAEDVRKRPAEACEKGAVNAHGRSGIDCAAGMFSRYHGDEDDERLQHVLYALYDDCPVWARTGDDTKWREIEGGIPDGS
jgi:hypothetical protein